MPSKPRSGHSKPQSRNDHRSNGKPKRTEKKVLTSAASRSAQRGNQAAAGMDFELKELPVALQLSILYVFKRALDKPFALRKQSLDAKAAADGAQEVRPLSELVQLVKSHLYNRDFDAAFADADGELLRAYALRWSAGRALAYAGIFGTVLNQLALKGGNAPQHVVCIGGGAGAELVGLAAAWKDLDPEEIAVEKNHDETNVQSTLAINRPQESKPERHPVAASRGTRDVSAKATTTFNRALTIVDIADWSSVVEQLKVVAQNELTQSSPISVTFNHTDILSYSETDLIALFSKSSAPALTLVTLMFTLNELFSVSIPKTTQFLLQLTDTVDAGSLLLVVDSPGSYSTVSIGAGKNDEERPQRTYPMRFLLDHTLLTVAEGRWECIASEASKWYRRDETRLRYSVGDGVGLEDMRFQLHLYRKLK